MFYSPLSPNQARTLRWFVGALCLAAYLWASETDYQDFVLSHSTTTEVN
jgi:hypothetical protein